MNPCKYWPLLAAFLLIGGKAEAAMDCAALAQVPLRDLRFNQPITAIKVTQVPAAGDVPAHCRYEGMIRPATRFVVKLPITNWNRRFVEVGNGGAAGVVREESMPQFLQEGYATAGDSAGHLGDRPLFSFAYNPPDNSNPDAAQKLIDLGYRSIHESSHAARKLIEAFYGAAPVRAYYFGSSLGGRQGLKSAQTYPKDFDGWFILFPVLAITDEGLAGVWNARQTMLGEGAITARKLPALAKAELARCDLVDGVADGLVSDPAACKFDARRDLPFCAPGQDNDDCFTAAQREALARVYAGPADSHGRPLFSGLAVGSAVFAPSTIPGTSNYVRGAPARSMWDGWVVARDNNDINTSVGGGYGASFMRSIVFQDPSWDWKNGDIDDYQQLAARRGTYQTLDALNADLSRARAAGAKIIHVDGWSDPLLSPYQSVKYFESVRHKLGIAQTDSFYRLYMVPGLGHGPSAGPAEIGSHGMIADWVEVLRDWVEHGKAPGEVVASRAPEVAAILGALSRPLCPYPEMAVYNGTGDTHVAASFQCRK